MTNIDIYAILASKPHNPHYLKRYWSFIQKCEHGKNEYVESHHICPKSSDLFPEYSSFTKNKWNRVYLTDQQHFLAHWMLWKAYGGKQTFAFQAMVNGWSSSDHKRKEKHINGKTYSILREEYRITAKETLSGKTMFKDSSGKRYYLSVDDEMVKSGVVVGIMSGISTGLGNFQAKNKETGESVGWTSVTDPDYISGKLVGQCHGISKSEEHKKKMSGVAAAWDSKTHEYLGKISRTDDRWKIAAVYGIGKGKKKNYVVSTPPRMAKDSVTGAPLGNIHPSDPRWKTGEIVSITKGTAPALLSSTGESLGRISITDPRWSTGEIVGTGKKLSSKKP